MQSGQSQIVEALKKARTESGLGQIDVADALGVTQSYVSKIEAGRVRLGLEHIEKLSSIYKRPLQFFTKYIDTFHKQAPVLNEIHLSRGALYNNMQLLRVLCPGQSLIPVLKSNAYGHGIEEVAQMLAGTDLTAVAVDSYFEALHIRAVSAVPLIIIGPTDVRLVADIALRGFACAVYSFEMLAACAALTSSIRVHIFVDTGMHREGFEMKDIPKVIHILKKNKHILCEGLMSHFADAETQNSSTIQSQNEHFSTVIDLFEAEQCLPSFIHLGNSAGCMQVRDPRVNAFRSGLALYGVNPFPKQHPFVKRFNNLQPVLTLTTTVVQIKQVLAGECIGYNATYRAPTTMRTALLPIGYSEGLDRRLSNVGTVTAYGTHCALLGRVSMNQSTCAATDPRIKVGSVVTVFSSNAADPNSIVSVAERIQMSPYELLTGISSSIRRTITQ